MYKNFLQNNGIEQLQQYMEIPSKKYFVFSNKKALYDGIEKYKVYLSDEINCLISNITWISPNRIGTNLKWFTYFDKLLEISNDAELTKVVATILTYFESIEMYQIAICSYWSQKFSMSTVNKHKLLVAATYDVFDDAYKRIKEKFEETAIADKEYYEMRLIGRYYEEEKLNKRD